MPPARTARHRAVNQENDENAALTRVTRAKAAALGGNDELSEGLVKKALQTKKATTAAAAGNGVHRRRAALGDLSNVVKTEAAADKGAKKAANGRTALGSKTTNGGIQKVSRTSSTRSTLPSKESSSKPSSADLKRPASGVGVGDRAQKKRSTGSAASQASNDIASTRSNEPVLEVPVRVEEITQVEKRETITIEEAPPQIEAEQTDVVTEVVPDLDAEDLEDPLMVAEYAVEIFTYLRELEQGSLPNPNYMSHQDHIDWTDRDVLNDWLIQVHQRFQLLPETFYLAINIVDRFLSAKIVNLDKLQLVGITALFIASKYEEVISPHVSNFTYMAKDYEDAEILSAERFILAALNYDLSYPNPMNFLRRISKADNYDIQTRTLGKYLLEISALDHQFLDFPPSQVAAAAMYMARMILGRSDWDATMAHYSGYSEDEIVPLFRLFVDYCSGEIKHEAFNQKYASKKYLKASLLVRQWSERYVFKLSRRATALAKKR